MIQVLLLILKIIGIAVLVILGLLLLVLALVLFVPVFYRVRVIHNPEKTQIKARITYLFPLLLVTVQYLKKLSYKVRIFGFSFLDSEKPKKEKPKKLKKEKRKKENQKKKPEEAAVKEKKEPFWEPLTGIPKENTVKEEANDASETESKTEQKEKPKFFEKIRCKIQKTRETIHNGIKKVKKIIHQIDEVQRILSKPETKQVFRFAWDKLKRLLKHIFPRKLKGYVAYGADNPATTGQVLGALSVIYAKTGQLLEIRPNFMEKQLECDIELKGHIQVFTLLVIALKILFNQELKQLITEVKKIKEIE